MTADSSAKYENASVDVGASNGIAHSATNGHGDGKTSWLQDPIAVVSMACRLPDECSTPQEFWKFLEQGKIAINTPPGTRFSMPSHYDASLKPQTMASPGGMFLQNVDIRDIDAKFFRLSGVEATSMDPQQRQLLEVVYEGLENGGVTLEELNDAPVGCFVSSFASDYSDIQSRDPENRASATVVGVGRAMLSARIAHWLNIHGPCMTLDTACSGALVGLDLAMRYLQTREASSAIVAGANLYCSPEWVMDRYMGANGTASLTGRCHTFDEKADGYIKSEAVCMIYLKRLDDAIRDEDPIRAIIRGTATNQDGWTAGIASPSAPAQTQVIRQAYRNAGISDISKTSYIEFHGTGTKAGDSIEANGVSAVFTPHQPSDRPLRIGSVKSNIGHSEPAAGLSALMKCVLSLEKGVIPENPTFLKPSPKIDFENIRMYTSRTATLWPKVEFRRASVNCFGYGGSNAHAIIDEARSYAVHHTSSFAVGDDFDDMFDADTTTRPYLLVLSANEDKSLDEQVAALDSHLSNPAISVKIRDLAFTLGQKRSRHYHRGFLITDTSRFDAHALTRGHESANVQRLGFVFTGQGAQWPTMGKMLLENLPLAVSHVKSLDEVLQSCPHPPKWTLFDELVQNRSADHLRLPEISQPVVTALQLAILAIFTAADIAPQAVVGHSSGEIAAAVAAGYMTPEQAILVAYYRGKATSMVNYDAPLGMMAVGLGKEAVAPYLEGTSIQVACVNSPQGVTLSGVRSELLDIEAKIKDAGHFARLLQVNAAYHSRHMKKAAKIYLDLLKQHVDLSPSKNKLPNRATVPMFSSTSGEKISNTPGPEYWVANMVSPVLFSTAVQDMIKDHSEDGKDSGIDALIEIGPANALAGPINQIRKAVSSSAEYIPAWKRGEHAMQTFLETAGKLFLTGYPVKLAPFNQDEEREGPQCIVDLPNYRWNHSVKYWHENESSLDWRFRRFVHHDLLGSKILGTPWERPTWKNVLRVSDVTWIQDHLLGDSIIFPGAGYIAMAVEAIYQKCVATGRLDEGTARRSVTYKLRNVTFPRMLKLDKDEGAKMLLALEPCMSTRETWHEFVISTISRESSDILEEHCRGLVSIGEYAAIPATPADVAPLKHAVPGAIWAKAMRDVGYLFGPAFLPTIMVEAKADSRQCRSQIRWEAPESRYPQSPYSMHPTIIDGCLQVATVALNRGYHSAINTLMPPALMDDLVIFSQPEGVTSGIVSSEAMWSGVGNPDDSKRFVSDIRGFGEGIDHKDMLFYLKGLHYHAINAASDRPHVLTQVVWKEDISFMSSQQISSVLQERAQSGQDANTAVAWVANLVSLIAHKNPSAKILEVENVASSTSLWIDAVRHSAGHIAQGCAYHFSLSSSASALKAREAYGAEANINFLVHDNDRSNPFGADDDLFDFALVRTSASANSREELQRAKLSLRPGGFVVLLHEADAQHDGELYGTLNLAALDPIPQMRTKDSAPKIAYVGRRTADQATENGIAESGQTAAINLLHFQQRDGDAFREARDFLQIGGWNIHESSIRDFGSTQDQSVVLVLDETKSPIMSNLSDDQLTALRALFDRGGRVLWVTKGSQMKVTNPENGLMFGASRSLLSEYPTSLFMCLDIEDETSPDSLAAVNDALHHLLSATDLARTDSEFVERRGIIHVSRVIEDKPINSMEEAIEKGAPVDSAVIQDHGSYVRLMTERVGSLDGLMYTEIPQMPPLADDEVEVEVRAAGMNFKDLAGAMGFVPANEKLFGGECCGVVARIGKGVSNVQPGQRVLMMKRDGGCFANRVRCRWHSIHVLPDWVSFEEGTTLGIAVHTAVYGLMTMADIQPGQSILIHSASGGVGLAAIDICKHIGCEIFVTVGNEEKRAFLEENYGITRDRMFSSRSTTFASQLMRRTKGRGVDVCLNSLTDDMLHESWRCMAEAGQFIEIGKKDMLDRNNLSMEPFDRNCSYRALDLSRKSISDEATYKTGTLIMEMLRKRHIRPLYICKVFPHSETDEAFRYMSRGKHIGKVVISYENKVAIPYRPAAVQFQLRSDSAYLIAGGLKGLCGSLAVYLARHGAKHIITISRSGHADARSQKVIDDCQTLGATVHGIAGDVTQRADVDRAFAAAAPLPVIGVIQGAMVLRDKMFESMTRQEFRDVVAPKVQGTWNLHRAALENGPLDFFTCLASVSGMIGQMGQSNYAAANAFLDSFANYRLQQGLPACSIDLGPVADVGYLDDNVMLNRVFEARGWTAVNEALLHRILRASILQQTHRINPASAGQLITSIMPGNTPFEPLHRFSSLRPGAGSAVAGAGAATGEAGLNTKLAMLQNAPKGEVDHQTLLAAATELVNSVLVRSLGLPEALDATRPLANYGVDSLVAVELRNWIRNELKTELSALDVVGARTLVELCETILKKIGNA